MVENQLRRKLNSDSKLIMEKSKAKCPRCKSKDLLLTELWKDAAIEWRQTDGEFDRADGNLSEGNPYKVEAKCCKCRHTWTLKGVIQIDNVIKEQ